MNKEILIKELFEHFKRDENLIFENLMKVMDDIYLETSKRNEKITLHIKYRRQNNEIK